nr:hypothetical protein BaRGS_033253 [Batillaria attramentaria]
MLVKSKILSIAFSKPILQAQTFSEITQQEENPEPNRCLGIFGLSLYTQERGLRDVFGRYGPIEEVQIVYDRQAKDRCNGIEIDGRRIRVDFSITERAHTPTPGIYLGKPTTS